MTLQKAIFEYEITNDREKPSRFYLNLYDRIDDKDNKDILRFLAQVEGSSSIDDSVQMAVAKVYDKMNNPISPLDFEAFKVPKGWGFGKSIKGTYIDKRQSGLESSVNGGEQ